MKRLFTGFLSLLLVLSLTACGEKHSAPEPSPPAPPVIETEPEEPILLGGDIVLSGDSYWVCYESEGDEREYVPEGDDLLTDLTLWADGTARIREIENDFWLVSDGDEQNMRWISVADGTIQLFRGDNDVEPYWTGIVSQDGTLELERFGGTYYFRQEPMPEGGAIYSPAELQGVWLQVGSEVEGDINATMPERFNSLIFRTDWTEDGQTLRVSSESGNSYGFVDGNGYYDREITVLDEALYSGCGNDEWSVRIGAESPLNESGYPENVETYVTLLDQNTLLQQLYFSIDGGPGVSYQTYKRFLPEVSYELEQAQLNNSYFELAGYIDADGQKLSEPPGMSNFTLYMNEYGYHFTVTFEDDSDYNGIGDHWAPGNGGTLLLCGGDSLEDSYAGAIRSVNGIPEIYLWDNAGGILRLKYVESDGDYAPDDDGEWNGYVETMNDLEGRAFAAPENALFVLYNQNYTDLTNLNAFPFYGIDEGPQAQYVLVTSVIDGNYFWLDEDGFCREDFGTVDAGESFVFQINLPESGGYLLQIESPLGNYFIELTQDTLSMDENWNYITT